MRGTIAGKGDPITGAAAQVKRSGHPPIEIDQSGSHTLQSRDVEDTQELRARLIDATVEAIADGSGPRLA